MSNDKIGLFWGSDTGVTEEIVKVICDQLGTARIEAFNVFDVSLSQFRAYNKMIFGLSTWYDGQLQSDWDNFFEQFQQLPFDHATVALFGTGDQEGYAQYFVDGIGIIGEVVLRNGGKIVGHWPTKGYRFTASKALVNADYFLGLALDEDNQPHLTDLRIKQWLEQLKREGFL
jgi:flavodoxin I